MYETNRKNDKNARKALRTAKDPAVICIDRLRSEMPATPGTVPAVDAVGAVAVGDAAPPIDGRRFMN